MYPCYSSGTVKRNRWVAYGIVLLPLFVILAASLLWIAVKNGHIDIVGNLGTHNNGTLMQPVRELDSIALFDAEGAPYVYAQQPAKWTLLIPGGDVCDDACLQTLWLTRARDGWNLHRRKLRVSWKERMEASSGVLPFSTGFLPSYFALQSQLF